MRTKQTSLQRFLAKGKNPSKENEEELQHQKIRKLLSYYTMNPMLNMNLARQEIPQYQPHFA